MTIEEHFLVPCVKCLQVLAGHGGADQGPCCPFHYALMYLHYSNNTAKGHRPAQNSNFYNCFPTGRQLVSNAQLLKEVHINWWRYEQGNNYQDFFFSPIDMDTHETQA